MNIQEINDLANDVAVARLMIKQHEEELEKLPGYQELLVKIENEKRIKELTQEKLIVAMKSESLKSWKTEQATFSRAVRSSVSTDPAYKKQIENRLKAGEKIEGFELTETEYLSIRIT